MRPLLSITFPPKDSESLTFLDIRLWKMGAKRRLNGTSKVSTHTDKHTNTHMLFWHATHRPFLMQLHQWPNSTHSRKFLTTYAVLISFEIVKAINLCNIVYLLYD